jgi:hypothetical protein
MDSPAALWADDRKLELGTSSARMRQIRPCSKCAKNGGTLRVSRGPVVLAHGDSDRLDPTAVQHLNAANFSTKSVKTFILWTHKYSCGTVYASKLRIILTSYPPVASRNFLTNEKGRRTRS